MQNLQNQCIIAPIVGECEMKEKNGFGLRLKKLRKNAGLTQNDLAAKFGKSGSAVRMWELGANEPDISTLVELSTIFDCSLDYLMCRDAILGKEGAVRTNIPVFYLSQYGKGEEPAYYKSISPEYTDTGFAYIMLHNDSTAMHPMIPQGALVLIRLQESCMDGQNVLFRLNGNVYLRKLSFCNGGIIFSGALPSVPPLFADISDASLEIIGTAVEYQFTL